MAPASKGALLNIQYYYLWHHEYSVRMDPLVTLADVDQVFWKEIKPLRGAFKTEC